LRGVVATSATNAWAVGSYRTAHRIKTLIEHWDGKAWTVQPSPNSSCFHPSPPTNELNGVAATSSTNAWAVGFCGKPFSSAKTLVEHWDGKG
jgi:hypothetical protein